MSSWALSYLPYAVPPPETRTTPLARDAAELRQQRHWAPLRPSCPRRRPSPELLPALPWSKSVDGLFFSTVLDFWPRDTFLYTIAKGGEVWDAVGVEVLHEVVRSERRCPRPFQRLNDLLYGGSSMRV